MTFAVKKGVALPASQSAQGRRPAYPFRDLEVNQMFFVPDRTTEQLSSYASLRGRKLGRRFATQSATMRQDLETNEWEPCAPGAPGCRHGVAIRRVA